VILVDSHCHALPYWYEPVESLLYQMDQNGVSYAILVQCMGQFNGNAYLMECVRRFPDRLAAVVLVDADGPTALQELERLAEQGARGVRLGPGTRSPGDDPLAIWRKADELGLPVTCGGTGADFASEEFADLVGSLPDLPIIIEHLGSLNVPDGEPAPYEIRRKAFSLTRFSNVYIKAHGLGEFCRRVSDGSQSFPFEMPVPPLLEMAYEAFGPHRMMWGSDYPLVSSREGYRNALHFTMDRLQSKGEEARELVFGRVARDLYGLRG